MHINRLNWNHLSGPEGLFPVAGGDLSRQPRVCDPERGGGEGVQFRQLVRKEGTGELPGVSSTARARFSPGSGVSAGHAARPNE